MNETYQDRWNIMHDDIVLQSLRKCLLLYT